MSSLKHLPIILCLIFLSYTIATGTQNAKPIIGVPKTQNGQINQTIKTSPIVDNGNKDNVQKSKIDELVQIILVEYVAPVYRATGIDQHLSIIAKCLFTVVVIIAASKVIRRLLRKEEKGKEKETNVLKDVKELKEQISTLTNPQSNLAKNAAKASMIASIKTELAALNQQLAKNETNVQSFMASRRKFEDMFMKFRNEVNDSHEAIWKDLNTLKKIMSQKTVTSSVSLNRKVSVEAASPGLFPEDTAEKKSYKTTPPQLDISQRKNSSSKPSLFCKVPSPQTQTESKEEVPTALNQPKQANPTEVAIPLGIKSGLPLSKMALFTHEMDDSSARSITNPFKVKRIGAFDARLNKGVCYSATYFDTASPMIPRNS